MRYKVLVLVCLLVGGCATATFKPWSNNEEVRIGKGGSLQKVEGIDVWEHGEPNRHYRIIGIIDCGAPITGGSFLVFNLLTTNSQVISTAKEQGADGVILLGSDQTYLGQTPSGRSLASLRQAAVAIKYVPTNKPTAESLEELKSNWTEEDRYAFDLGIAARYGEFIATLYKTTGHKTLSKSSREMTVDDIFGSYKDSPEKLRGLHEVFEFLYSYNMGTISPDKAELPDNLKKILSGASSLSFPFNMGEAYESGFINALMDKIPMIPRSERETKKVPFTYYKNETKALEELHRAYEWGYLHCQMEQRKAR